jgi:hypothetical protein
VLSDKAFAEARDDLRQVEGDRLASTERFVELPPRSPVHAVVVDLDTLAF